MGRTFNPPVASQHARSHIASVLPSRSPLWLAVLDAEGVVPARVAHPDGRLAANGWFAARPSGTEDVYKIYAESFVGREHLARVQDEARALVAAVLAR